MRILSDYHHSDLYESLRMLFEDRFGWELYRPIGMEWFDSGIWQFEKAWHGDAIAKQYLTIWGDDRDCGDHWQRDDQTHPGRVHKMVTLEQARSQDWDIVLATLSENEPGMAAFARERGAKYGIQIGNQGALNQWDLADFGLCSTTLPFVPWKPYVTYHQEFSLTDFRYEYPPAERSKASTWVQCLSEDAPEYSRFLAMAEAAPELQWRFHGHCGNDNPLWESNVKTTPELAAQMRAAGIGVHFKTWSDGYGHVIHNLFAVGKPIIATAGYYHGSRDGLAKLAGPLFVEGVTSFDVQSHSVAEIADIARRLATDDEFHHRISDASAARFAEIVNFDEDAEKVRTLLESVL